MPNYQGFCGNQYAASYNANRDYASDGYRQRASTNLLLTHIFNLPQTTINEVVYVLQTQDVFDVAGYLVEKNKLTTAAALAALAKRNLFVESHGKTFPDLNQWENLKRTFFKSRNFS